MMTMKLSAAVATILAAVALTGCATTGLVAPSTPPRIDAPDAALTKRCAMPIVLPNRALTQQEIEKYWGTDRAHQVDCARRYKILVDYIQKRDAGLTGATK